MTKWMDAFGVVHVCIRVYDRVDGRDTIAWDTVCFHAVRIRHLPTIEADAPVSCLFCLVDPWSEGAT
jgi:hypothetical protein